LDTVLKCGPKSDIWVELVNKMWMDLFQSFQQQVSCDTTTQLLHTNTVSSTGGISAALNTVQRLQFTLDITEHINNRIQDS